MAEKDEGAVTRLDAARKIVHENELIGKSAIGICDLFSFDEKSKSIAAEGLDGLEASGETTAFHTSITGILRSAVANEKRVGLFLLTDGHDFEGVSAQQIGQQARNLHTPIYPIPLGRTVQLPDIELTMVSAQPSTFVKQKVRLEAAAKFSFLVARVR